MARISTNDRNDKVRKPDHAAQNRELTGYELENVWGGSITKSVDLASPAFFKNCTAGSAHKSS
jgi:type VI protein secretion system component Hcp